MSGSYENYSTPATSDGGALTDRTERKKKPRNQIQSLGNKRYWNEFDADEDTLEPYTIMLR